MNLDYPLVVCVHVSCLHFFLLKTALEASVHVCSYI